ncbi:MAG: pyrroline-5-carboxylate reductase [Pseudomonadota bacterium]
MTVLDPSRPRKIPVVLLGAGNMGGAMLRGWHDADLLAPGSVVIDPHADDQIKALCAGARLSIAATPDDAIDAADPEGIFVIAIKPQMAAKILPRCESLASGRGILSVMAGQSLATIAQCLSLRADAPMVRAMPNVGSAVGAGATGLFANEGVTEGDRERVTRLMTAIGACVWVPHEADIDAVTAVSGSGPAYFFLLVEALTAAGIAEGLSPNAAATLARATAFGVGTIIQTDSRSAEALRQSVTSPGGTTAAALEVYERGGALRALTGAAVKAAISRAAELNADPTTDD